MKYTCLISMLFFVSLTSCKEEENTGLPPDSDDSVSSTAQEPSSETQSESHSRTEDETNREDHTGDKQETDTESDTDNTTSYQDSDPSTQSGTELGTDARPNDDTEIPEGLDTLPTDPGDISSTFEEITLTPTGGEYVLEGGLLVTVPKAL